MNHSYFFSLLASNPPDNRHLSTAHGVFTFTNPSQWLIGMYFLHSLLPAPQHLACACCRDRHWQWLPVALANQHSGQQRCGIADDSQQWQWQRQQMPGDGEGKACTMTIEGDGERVGHHQDESKKQYFSITAPRAIILLPIFLHISF